MANPLLYDQSDFVGSTPINSIAPEQLNQEFALASFPNTPVTYSHIDVQRAGANFNVQIYFSDDPDATDEATADALVAAHTAAGSTDLLDPETGVTLVWDSTAMTDDRVTASLILPADVRNLSIRLSWSDGSGPTTGTFTIEGSDDDSYWEALNIDVANLPDVAANSGDILLNLSEINAPFVRCAYAFGSGTGTLVSAHVIGKLS